jgi:hypothetical protein
LARSLEKLEAMGLSVLLLPPWYDVDTGDDLSRLRADLQRLPPDHLEHTRRFFDR